jgi:hypothetical protein
MAHFGCGQPPVDRDQDGAALGAAEEDLVVVLGLLAEVGDPVALAEPGGADGVRDPVAAAVQCAVGEDRRSAWNREAWTRVPSSGWWIRSAAGGCVAVDVSMGSPSMIRGC